MFLTETFNAGNEMFEKKLWGDLLPSLRILDRPFVNALYEKLVSFRGCERFEDDVCLIGIEIL